MSKTHDNTNISSFFPTWTVEGHNDRSGKWVTHTLGDVTPHSLIEDISIHIYIYMYRYRYVVIHIYIYTNFEYENGKE